MEYRIPPIVIAIAKRTAGADIKRRGRKMPVESTMRPFDLEFEEGWRAWGRSKFPTIAARFGGGDLEALTMGKECLPL